MTGNSIARGTENVGYREKYMNGGNTGVFKKNSVCSSTHPHENNGTISVYIEKATYHDYFPWVQDGVSEIMANNSLALILLIAHLEKRSQFDIHRKASHTAG